MAFSATLKRQSIFGTLKAQVWEVNSAGVTGGTIATGLSSVDHISLNNKTTEGEGLAVDSGSNVVLSGLVSNDLATVLVIGV